MNSKYQNVKGNILNDAIWTMILVSLLLAMLYLGFSTYGLQNFGSRSQILCRISAGLLIPLVIVRFWGHFHSKPNSYIKTDVVFFLLPLIFLPCASQIAGGASLAMTRFNIPTTVNSSQMNGKIPPVVINPLTGKPVNSKNQDNSAVPSRGTENDTIPNEGPIILTPDNYERIYAALFDQPDLYIGRVIEIDGFAYPEKSLPNGEWIVGRLLMVCCPGDGTLVGFPAKMPAGFKSESVVTWWKIVGTLETLTIRKQVNPDSESNYSIEDHIPCIKVTYIKQQPMPDDPYLYPQ